MTAAGSSLFAADTPDDRPAADFQVDYDLSTPAGVNRWRALHKVASLKSTDQGMRIEISGVDPYIAGPPADFPAAQPLLLRMRLKSTSGGMGQVFYYDRHTTEDRSVRFPVPANRWHDVAVSLPPLGPGYRLRFDPPGQDGECFVVSLSLGRPLQASLPTNPAPTPFAAAEDDFVLSAEGLQLRHSSKRWNDFSLMHGDQLLAAGHNRLQIGYWRQGKAHWLPLVTGENPTQPQAETRVARRRTDAGVDLLEVHCRVLDRHGGTWRLTRTFTPHPRNGFRVETKASVDSPREVVFLPDLIVLAGHGSFGARKNQAILAGVEYLEDEPSSSEADLEGPAALRRVPANYKITFPFMAVQHAGHYLALAWQRNDHVAALFDSPDRLWHTRSHVMGLIAPGAHAQYRGDGEPSVHTPWKLTAEQPYFCRAELYAGEGNTLAPAISEFVARRGLPELPAAPSLDQYVQGATAGWLDGALREGDKFRHAVGNQFVPQPAFDAAWMLRQLADVADDEQVRMRCREAARGAASVVAPGNEYFSHVGHLQQPAGGLAFSKYEATREQALRHFQQVRKTLDANGIATYHAPPQGIDFSRTHTSREGNGLAALAVMRMLQSAAYAGGEAEITEALAALKRLDRYLGQVPRGAQTWEIALHTPDILASAHLVKAYSLAFQLTGDSAWLERARYWAWTGVPFVYLDNPTEQSIGPYATIAVLGATHWKAPVWIGLPVQWCGLVYAESLYQLAGDDQSGPWKRLADGIVISAIQQTYPSGSDRQGLLPDSFDLQLQSRNPADINPGTLQPLALQYYTGLPAYNVRGWASSERRLWACLAGKIRSATTETTAARIVDTLQVQPWHADAGELVVQGLTSRPEVRVAGRVCSEQEAAYLMPSGTLRITIPGKEVTRIELIRAR